MAVTSKLLSPFTRQAWWPRPGNGFAIEAWLDRADADAPLVERHIWLVRILDWVREGEPVAHVQYLLHLLQADRERRDKAVQLLAACWRDVDVTEIGRAHV